VIAQGVSQRKAAIRWAREIARDRHAIYLDTESTGLGPQAEIVDVALVSGDGTLLFESLVRPTVSIPDEASAIHGIYDHHVAGAPAWEEVAPYLAALLTGARVVVYNARFDSDLINQCCSRSGFDPFARQWECAMLTYAAYAGEPGKWGRGFRWHKLDAAAAAFGFPPGGHRALADAVTCRNVVLAMAESAPL
jgi:DNA polymerase III epsilon subunit-like protein